MGNQSSNPAYLARFAGDTDTDDQEPEPSDAGRVRCALYDAASARLSAAGGRPRTEDLPMWVLENPLPFRLFSHVPPHMFPHAAAAVLMDVVVNDFLRTRVEHLCFLVDKLGNPSMFLVRTAIAQYIHSTMQVEFEAVSEEDTLALVTGTKAPDSDNAKKVINMCKLIMSQYKSMRPVNEINMSVEKLCDWHKALFDGIDHFKHAKIGQLRDSGVASAGGRVYPTRKLAAAALETLCEVVNACAHKESRRPPVDRVDTVMRIFALAAFAQYHLVEIHPFFDGNGRLCRYLCKYILESCLPLPFPMYADRDDYLQALKVGDEACQDPGGARGAYAPLLLVTIEAAIQYYEELLQLSSKPLLIGRTPEEIEHAIKEQRVTCTPEDKETIKRAFDALPAFATGTVKLSEGSVQITKVVSIKPGIPEPEKIADTEIDDI